MAKDKAEGSAKEPVRFEDSILVGILEALGLKNTAQKDLEKNKVFYLVEGDVEKALQHVYSNQLVGALDVLRSIKSARSAIFNLRGKK